MAITDNAIEVVSVPFEGEEWSISMYSANLTGGEILKAAVAGRTHYIKVLKIRCAAATVMSLGDAAAAGALTHTFLGPIPFLIASLDFDWNFSQGGQTPKAMKLTESLAFCIIQVGAGAAWIYAEGKTCKET